MVFTTRRLMGIRPCFIGPSSATTWLVVQLAAAPRPRPRLRPPCHFLGVADVVMSVDVAFKNAFPSLEWDAIREAVGADLPALSPWTHWCHARPARVVLPSGVELSVDRGAEQGDPFGPFYCVLVLARVAACVRARLGDEVPFFDACYLDDGQLVCKPADLTRAWQRHLGSSKVV